MLGPYPHPQESQIECPHCRRHSVVKHGESEYVCLNCDFRRDLSQPYLGGFGNVLLGALAFILVLYLSQS
jgi:DNA-directed RNA polymerase subunit RPC12/RpoP